MENKIPEKLNMRDPLIIKDKGSGVSYYGGNQEWYKSNTRAYAGCGSVACANMLRILAHKYPDWFEKKDVDRELSGLTGDELYKDDFISFMGNIYKSMLVHELPLVRSIYDACGRSNKVFKYVIKPSFGMSINGFIRGSLKYARSRGVLLHVRALPTAFCPYEKGLDFIKEGIEKGGCVVMLTALNRHPLKLYSGKTGEIEGGYDLKKGVRSHFMTITDLIDTNDDGPLVKITTWGRVATVPYKKLNRSWQKIRAYTSCLYYFTPAQSEAVVRADIRNSTILCIQAVFKGLFGWIR